MLHLTTRYPVSQEQLPPIDRTDGFYRLRFGRTMEDLAAVQRLRFDVFNRELGEGLHASWTTGLDADPWDAIFHHIVVEHLPTGGVVGSYRLQTGDTAERHGGFYSEAEFDLQRLPRDILRDSVEIGRACVHAGHRNGRVIHLLWRGLASYLLWNAKGNLFGCCSLPTINPAVGATAWRQLKLEGFVSRRYSVEPQRGLDFDLRNGGASKSRCNELPALFQSYLNLGAEVCGPPAVDAEFGRPRRLGTLPKSRSRDTAPREAVAPKVRSSNVPKATSQQCPHHRACPHLAPLSGFDP